jgi:hypothetical protein
MKQIPTKAQESLPDYFVAIVLSVKDAKIL